MLNTELRNPRTTYIDKLTSLEMVRLMNEENMYSVLAVDRALDDIARAVDAASEAIGKGLKATRPGLSDKLIH